MGKFTQTRKFTTREEVTHTKLNDIMSTATISNIKNADIAADAAIVDTKLAAITTTSKVNATALGATDQATGDIGYFNGTSWARLAIGSAGQKLKLAHDGANAYNKLMLHADGTDGGTTFTDDNVTAKTVTNTANYDTYTKVCSHFDGDDAATAYTDPVAGAYTFVGTAQLDTAQKKFGTASLLLDGNSDCVTLPDSADWNFGAGDFTIDMWVRFAAVGDNSLIGQGDNTDTAKYWRLIFSGNNLYFQQYEAAVQTISVSAAWVPTINTWYHVALVRTGNNFMFFINGTQIGTTQTDATPIADFANKLIIGADNADTPANFFNGWIDEVRISKGIARWTATFTVPAYPYGQVITSTAQQKFGTASGYFDGGGSLLSIADSADWNFGTGDFTFDFWVRFNDITGYQMIVSQYQNDTNFLSIYKNSDNGITIASKVGGTTMAQYSSTTSIISTNTWYHIAIVRNSSSMLCFLNGVSQTFSEIAAVGTNDLGNLASTLDIGFRGGGNNDWYFNGWIDEFRVSKGIARWTANFTPPTAAYTPLPIWVTP